MLISATHVGFGKSCRDGQPRGVMSDCGKRGGFSFVWDGGFALYFDEVRSAAHGTARPRGRRLLQVDRADRRACWSRKTVRPSLRVSWNQSRHVTRLPVQLWKYSCAITPCTRSKSASEAARHERRRRPSGRAGRRQKPANCHWNHESLANISNAGCLRCPSIGKRRKTKSTLSPSPSPIMHMVTRHARRALHAAPPSPAAGGHGLSARLRVRARSACRSPYAWRRVTRDCRFRHNPAWMARAACVYVCAGGSAPVSGLARTHEVLKTLRPLFSIAAAPRHSGDTEQIRTRRAPHGAAPARIRCGILAAGGGRACGVSEGFSGA